MPGNHRRRGANEKGNRRGDITGFGEAAQRGHRLDARDKLRVLENGFDQVGASRT